MTNTVELERLITDSGLKLGYIAERLGITRQALWMKIENQTEFKPSEIQILCDLLSVDSLEKKEIIFFAPEVDERQHLKEKSEGVSPENG